MATSAAVDEVVVVGLVQSVQVPLLRTGELGEVLLPRDTRQEGNQDGGRLVPHLPEPMHILAAECTTWPGRSVRHCCASK